MSDESTGRGLTLVDAMNTYDPALLALRKRSYQILVRPASDMGEGEEWLARKDGYELIASDPLRLLGLAAILESRGTDWQLSENEPHLYDALRSAAYQI